MDRRQDLYFSLIVLSQRGVCDISRPQGSLTLNSIGEKPRAMKFTRITVNPNQMGGVPCLRHLGFRWLPLSGCLPKV